MSSKTFFFTDASWKCVSGFSPQKEVCFRLRMNFLRRVQVIHFVVTLFRRQFRQEARHHVSKWLRIFLKDTSGRFFRVFLSIVELSVAFSTFGQRKSCRIRPCCRINLSNYSQHFLNIFNDICPYKPNYVELKGLSI